MERDPARGRHVEGVEAVGHRDARGAAAGKDAVGEARSLGAEQQGGLKATIPKPAASRASHSASGLSALAKGTIRAPPTETRIALR
jgi:hypothetical protein